MGHDGYYLFGSITRTHGVKGGVVVRLDVDDPVRYKKIKQLFVETGDVLKQYRVTSASVSGDQAIFILDGIADMDVAATLKNHPVYLPLNELPVLSGKKLYLHEAIGMQVIDTEKGALGIIDQVFDLPEQPVARVLCNGKEVLFPLIESFIVKVDRAAGELHVALPDGLVDIYLNIP
ncbi:MAG TPA: ribosome maturation factor RimM [Bacteroidia bacterium]|nr:ribosome maturation factor RimM [Bacteroidia bacterium]